MRREVSIVMPTRNRPQQVATAVSAALSADADELEVVVVDQSDDDATRLALAELGPRDDLRYVRAPGPGSAAARNLGVREASAEIIGLTDDDCEVSADWVRELVTAFAVDRRIGVVFGNVLPAPHDGTAGFIPAHVREQGFVAVSAREKHLIAGMAACMGVRRSTWESLGGFDEMLGSGAPLRSAAETDFALRALDAGDFVSCTPRMKVLHHGFRSWEEGRKLIDSYWYGTGAMLAKPLKRGQADTWGLLARLGARWAFGRSPVAASLGRRPHKALRLAAFVQGFGAGILTPIDGASGQYRPRRASTRAG